MGYTTEFKGKLQFSKPLSAEQVAYVNLFSHTRRMKRDPEKLAKIYGGKSGLLGTDNYGFEGEYFAHDDGNYGQVEDDSIIEYNIPPGQKLFNRGNETFDQYWDENQRRIKEGECVPGLWCGWEISNDGIFLQWDGGEKFYNYVEWLQWMIKHFFEPWGYELNGKIKWQGENRRDKGTIAVAKNIVTI